MVLKLEFALCFLFTQLVFSQPLAPGQLKQKVDEIAKAYAEGYKAAITALQARNMIPKRPMAANIRPQINQRSYIPKPFNSQVVQNVPPASLNGFAFPSRQITVNGVEKSGIPRPQYHAQLVQPLAQRNTMKHPGHIVVERSAAPPPLLGKFMDQQMSKAVIRDPLKKSNVPQATGAKIPDETRASEMARLNAAARHRNVYFDAMGGDPYAGGASAVLSHQHVQLLRSRRSAEGRSMRTRLRRHGRSRMPYLGQDLDKLGIVRAVPVFNAQGKQQDNGLPSFMKVHAAEFGSFNEQTKNGYAAQRNAVPQMMTMQQAYQIPQAMYRFRRR